MAGRLQDVILRGLRADQPDPEDVSPGTLYYVTDEGVTERAADDNLSWEDYSDGGSGGITQLTGDVTAGPGTGSQAATIANLAVSAAKLAADSVITTKILDANVTKAKIENSVARSVIGRAGATTGVTADIVAANDGEVLRRSGTDIGFGTIVAAGLASDSVITAKILDGNVTYAKIQDVSAASRLLGRGSAGGAGDVEEITLGTNLSMSGTTLNASGGGGGGGLTLLDEQVASNSASLDFTGSIDATFDEYLIELINLVPATTNVEPILRVSTDNGANYDSGNNYTFAGIIVRQAIASGVGGTGQTSFRLTGGGTLVNTASLAGISGTFRLYNPLSTTQRKTFVGHSGIQANDGNFYMIPMSGQYEVTANDVDAFQVLMSSGNITSGTVRLYGIEK